MRRFLLLGISSLMLLTWLAIVTLTPLITSPSLASATTGTQAAYTTDGDKTYSKPRYKDQRLDWCLTWGNDCGKAAADLFCQGGDVREDLKRALQNLHDVKSFRARTESNGVTLLEIEFVNPDRFHWQVKSGKDGAGKMILIGKDTFVRKGNSSWLKSTVSMGGDDPASSRRECRRSHEQA